MWVTSSIQKKILGDFQVQYKKIIEDFQVQYKQNIDDVQVQSKENIDDVQVQSKQNIDDFRVIYVYIGILYKLLVMASLAVPSFQNLYVYK